MGYNLLGGGLTGHRYHTDPSGTFVRYEAKAIGSGSDAAQQSLQDSFHKVSCSVQIVS